MKKIWLFLFCAVTRSNSESPSFLYELLQWPVYDKLLAPQTSANESTQVSLEVFIESLSSLEESSMDYEVDCYMWMTWFDARLKHNYTRGNAFIATNDPQIDEMIWWPDLYIANAKRADFMYVTVPNKNIRFYPNGTIWTSRRVRATLSCNMELHRFPTDKQKCYMKMLTYMSLVDSVNISWVNGTNSIHKDESVELPDYEVHRVYVDYCNGAYSVGNYSCLLAIFELKRFSGFHLFQTFIPSSFIVIMSWIGFWINPRAVPARVTLSITTFLALTTQSQGVKLALPAVSYATGVDIWTTICTIFVFGALLEFAVAYHLWEKETQMYLGNREDADADDMGVAEPHIFKPTTSHATDRKQEKRNGSVGVATQFSVNKRTKEMKSSRVDRVSRIMFPIAFLICNAGFWYRFPPNLNSDNGYY